MDKPNYMDKETWDAGERAIRALKSWYYYNGREIKDKLRNSYIEKALPGRTKLINDLLSISEHRKIYYAALVEIADYHAVNEDDKDIPEKLTTWLCRVVSKRAIRPIHEPDYMRDISQRHRLIINSMIILVEFETWSIRQAAILTGDIVCLTQGAIEKVWSEALENRNNPDRPEYMGFFITFSGDGAKGRYQAWKKDGYNILDAST